MKRSATMMTVGVGAVLAALVLPGAASAASADLPGTGSAAQRIGGEPVGPRLDGQVINNTSYLLKLEAKGSYSGNIVQAPSETIGPGPHAHGTFDIQSRGLAATEADFHYTIEGTAYKVALHNYVPTLGKHDFDCAIVDGTNQVVPTAPFTCSVTERNSGLPSLWNPSPEFTLQAR